MEFTLLAAAAIAVGAVYVALWWEAKRGNAADCTADLWDIALGAMVVGLVVGRLAAMIGNGVNPVTAPGDILIVRSGVDTGFAVIGALATVGWLGRRELVPVVDGLAVASLAGLAGWHAACLFRGACLGTTTALPWAMTQPGSPVGRHPVELYAAALYGLAAVGLAVLRSRRSLAPGLAASLALSMAGLVRLVTEPFRPSLTGGPIGWYVAAIVIGTAGAVVAIRRSR